MYFTELRVAIEPSGGRRTRIGPSVVSAGLGTVLLLAFALPGSAKINGTQPPSGRVEQGEATSFVVALSGTGVTCVVTTPSDPSITVTMDVVSTCGNADRTVQVRVATSAVTPIGEHTITIVEVDPLGGAVDEGAWILEVVAQQTASSTSTTTTTTTTISGTSTTAAPAAPATTTTHGSATSTTNPSGIADPPVTTTTRPALPHSDSTTTTDATTTTPEPATTTTTTTTTPTTGLDLGQNGPGSGEPRSAGPGEATTLPALSRNLRSALGSVLPTSVADIVVSPLLILEVVTRAVMTSGGWALIPTALAGVLAGWVVWKLAPPWAGTEDPHSGWQFLPTEDPL